MPSRIAPLFASAGCTSLGSVRWGEPVPTGDPGVYLISLDERIDSTAASLAAAPISIELLERWLAGRETLALDGRQPTAAELCERLSRCWLPDEVILYIGLAGSSLSTRVRQYYSTPLGARSPHAGGHWLKTLSNLERLYVHYAPATDPKAAERTMLDRFCAGVSEETRTALFDPERPLPFANLDWPGHGAKRHGITGSKAPRSRRGASAKPLAGTSPRASGSRPTLHGELLRILCARGNAWMTTAELAAAVTAAGRYRKTDGTAITAFKVHGRARSYPHLFERDGSRVRAVDCP